MVQEGRHLEEVFNSPAIVEYRVGWTLLQLQAQVDMVVLLRVAAEVGQKEQSNRVQVSLPGQRVVVMVVAEVVLSTSILRLEEQVVLVRLV